MIPRVAKSGRSFKGAAQYYLHDKKANTSERVAFVDTLNLPTTDADRAIAHMIDTATHADQLKKASGLKAGRKLEKPVYVYSLAWHPSEAPTQAEQVAAARETISVLGLISHQALIVAHNDTDHPHVHVIVNRVDPETGKAAVMSKDQLKLSKWAQDYERRHGQILCEARVQNNAERDKGKWQKHQPMTRREHYEWKKQTTAELWREYRAEKEGATASRKPQYQALWQQRENRMAARTAEIKALFKPRWREMFKAQRKALADFDNGVIERIGFALSRQNRSAALGILEAVLAPGGLRHEFLKKQEIERVDLGIENKRAVRDAAREVTKAWKYDRDQLKEMHRQEDKARLEGYRSATDAVWNNEQANTPAIEQTASQTPQIASQREQVKEARKQHRARKSFAERMRENTPAEDIQKAQDEVRKRAKRERRRGRDNTGRDYTPD